MTNVIIIVILAAALIVGVKHTVKHLKGQGACCGGGNSTPVKIPEKELKGEKLGEKVVSISGMHCDHCVAGATKAINGIEGASAKVNLRKKQAIVSYDREITDESIIEAVEKAGFKVEEIK